MIDGANRSGNQVPTSRTTADYGFFGRMDAAVAAIGSSKLAADAIGVSVDTIARWRKGPTMPPFDKVIALCRAAGVHVHWLATGEEPSRLQPKAALLPKGTEEQLGGGSLLQGVVLLPRLAVQASAGSGLIAISDEVEDLVALSQAYLRQIGVDPRNAHVLQVSGRSMAPTINDKDVVVVDASKTMIHGDGIYTIVYGDAVLVKRVRMLRDGSVIIISDNKSEGYSDEVVSRSELNTLRIVGQVRGQVRAL